MTLAAAAAAATAAIDARVSHVSMTAPITARSTALAKRQRPVCRRFEAKAAADLEASQRLKGEHGILRRRFAAVEKETQALRDQIKTLMAQKAQAAQVRSLKSSGHGSNVRVGRQTSEAGQML